MARRFWPGRNPVGQRSAFPAAGGAPAWNEVVGVAGDVSHDGIGAAPIAELYLPYLQNPDNGGALVVRTSVNDPLLLTPALRRAAASVDPDQAFIDLRTMRETATQSVAMQRFSMLLLGAFSAFATLLTALGLYGTLAHAVGRRTRELGVRIALGATPRSIARLVAGRAALLLSLGVVLGTLAALLGARLIASQLYGVAPRDRRRGGDGGAGGAGGEDRAGGGAQGRMTSGGTARPRAPRSTRDARRPPEARS